MRKNLLQMYHDLKESGSSSDFPFLLANTMYKVLIDKFKGVSSPWKQYTLQGDLADFKTADRVIVSEAPDLLEIEEDGEYKDSKLTDDRYQIALKTYGRTFSIGRRVIINDDLDAIKKQPARFGRSSARTLVKKIVAALEGDSLSYDGYRLLDSLRHSNVANVALTNDATGIAAVVAGMVRIAQSTEPRSGEKMGITAKFIMVPPELLDVAERIINGTIYVPVSTSGGSNDPGMVRRLTPIMEPFLTSTTGWYIMADPNDAPWCEVGFLNGKVEPDLLMKRADTVSLAGGEDPYGYEFDEIFYKVRHDWAIATAMHQGIYRGKA